jgi:hypothetical protein
MFQKRLEKKSEENRTRYKKNCNILMEKKTINQKKNCSEYMDNKRRCTAVAK